MRRLKASSNSVWGSVYEAVEWISLQAMGIGGGGGGGEGGRGGEGGGGGERS